MNINQLKTRLNKDRPQTNINLQIPEDLIEDLKKVASHLGFSNIEALIRAYIGQGLRMDLERLNNVPEVSNLIESLRRQGVKEEVIDSALADLKKVA
ncbi:MAG TPA: hypothetical protein VF721_22080 [Pyrinomonadaceae bacterium]|jgi:hypothetical protein